mmetsp:Transcript_28887/g.72986  ORF Transcript_28887/g.72986 Transcript_28887/m.72986 type:complete len:244 (-) Transcript_28887:566-1297(-)
MVARLRHQGRSDRPEAGLSAIPRVPAASDARQQHHRREAWERVLRGVCESPRRGHSLKRGPRRRSGQRGAEDRVRGQLFLGAAVEASSPPHYGAERTEGRARLLLRLSWRLRHAQERGHSARKQVQGGRRCPPHVCVRAPGPGDFRLDGARHALGLRADIDSKQRCGHRSRLGREPCRSRWRPQGGSSFQRIPKGALGGKRSRRRARQADPKVPLGEHDGAHLRVDGFGQGAACRCLPQFGQF